MKDLEQLLALIQQLHVKMRDTILLAFESGSVEEMARIERDEEGDTIFAVDSISEELLIQFFRKEVAPDFPMVLISEGLKGGKLILPDGINEDEALWRIIMDPIDGTRVLMYQKRSA